MLLSAICKVEYEKEESILCQQKRCSDIARYSRTRSHFGDTLSGSKLSSSCLLEPLPCTLCNMADMPGLSGFGEGSDLAADVQDV